MFRAPCAHHVLIVRRSELYYTASGIITTIGGHPVHRCIVCCVRLQVFFLTLLDDLS